MIRVLIADDHAVVCEGLAKILSSSGDIEVIAKVSSGAAVLQQIRKADFDVVLMDLSMPGMDGLEALKQIKAERPKLPVLLFSMHAEDQYALRCIKAGAAGYLNKACEKSELIEAVRNAAEGKKHITPAVAECLASEIDQEVDQALSHSLLSDREFEVFKLIAQGKAPREMAKTMKLSPKTISTYRERILQKMGLGTNAALMRYAFENHLAGLGRDPRG